MYQNVLLYLSAYTVISIHHHNHFILVRAVEDKEAVPGTLCYRSIPVLNLNL